MAAAVAKHRTALITGASGGIGVPTAEGLLRALPTLDTLFLCNRDVAKSEPVAESLRATAPNVRIEIIPLDLSKLSSVRECARLVHSALGANSKLDVAVFNAGVMACPLQYTDDGVEYQYGVNHLGHALLALSLGSKLGRSVFVSSAAVRASGGLIPLIAGKTRGFDEATYSRIAAYGDSKLAMSMFARGLALQGVDTVSLHPGIVSTELQRHVLPTWMFDWLHQDGFFQGIFKKAINMLGLKTPEQGATLSIHLATAVDGDYKKGAMYLEKDSECPTIKAPLLYVDDDCGKVTTDTRHFLERFITEKESGAPIDLGP